MKINKKGFTLIELLAVIVILAIITIIAVPKILDVIEKSKIKSADNSFKLVQKTIKNEIAAQSITGTLYTKDADGVCYTFDFDNQNVGNAKLLNIKNIKELKGIIKYCNGKFDIENSTLTWQGINLKFEENISDDINNKVEEETPVYLSKTKFQAFASKNSPTEIVFDITGATEGEDISQNGDGSILAWMDENTMHISRLESGKKVYAPEQSISLFSNGSSVSWHMYISKLDLTNLNTSKVTLMNSMFWQTGEKVEKFTILGFDSWNTSKVTNMDAMFFRTGIDATEFSIGNLLKWNTSKVTNMYRMFLSTGLKSKMFNIGNIASWDTGEVTNMGSMFDGTGFESGYLLDLYNWNVSKVTSYNEFNLFTSKNVTPPIWVN